MKKLRTRNGYIFLLSVIVTGVISMTIVLSLLLLSISAERTGFALQESSQSLSLAELCAEHALLILHENAGYLGDETIEKDYGECYVLFVGGSGNENRTVCTEGISGDTVRRLEIVVQRLIPSVTIYSWQEVEEFTICEYE